MKFALVSGERREAAPGISGECPGCGQVMIAKCGELRVWHWAHRGMRTCDVWWEPETEWHRQWKSRFPDAQQEVFQQAQDGERHIADVKTEHGVVLEFQHSYLRKEERQSREAFYWSLVWVVDGLRRSRDEPRFVEAFKASQILCLKPLTFAFPSDGGALLRDWTSSRVPVFFDFGEQYRLSNIMPSGALFYWRLFPQALASNAPILWRLDSTRSKGAVRLSPVRKAEFLHAYQNGEEPRGIDCSLLAEFARRAQVYGQVSGKARALF